MTNSHPETDPETPVAADGGQDGTTQDAAASGTSGTDGAAGASGASRRGSDGAVKRTGDRVFETLSTGAAALITVIIGAIGLFLLLQAIPALSRERDGFLSFFTYGDRWDLNHSTNEGGWMQFGIPNMFFTTVMVSVLALLIAMPVALGIAVFLSNYCPKRAVRPLGFVIDLLAAVPSIVFGIWGMQVLGPALGGFYEWLTGWAGGFILFNWEQGTSPAFSTSRNIFTGGIVLAIMILPIIAATAREVFVQTPRGQIEAALALGATRWEVVRMTVLPFGRSGYISGAMLGLGRALGETMALYMVIASAPGFRGSLMDGGTTFATAIANAAPEFNDDLKAGAYIAAGLVLFVLTFLVNAAARSLVNNTK
ncbi:MAG: phosphate ABC transporter permease subunit PstC [Corynebacterium sp.]|uniref:phosphate ABC transporter permease subunit PstC n=1 Tax=unclassified Corynebacterium TaxID=2624378 RepID=UPI00264A3162|nr:phosphate ABC transporter permease subunit PstC [Corynebacterium sp.]MDN5582499.1 phosphate ABC transporter permease subunit PstC [Corynebacterium sp.]MDN5719794.1 phosphate ABC transporter permease subunit PstC [Corynebacterium sp.]MDN6258193.1 phosphate ABC transporter permease subunit PstC [Corynebacterium sp.]MDN6325192.1 phosphate ABC transporter permease subunit PstC [Corynebacterium sp.]MDN6509349.1 phosphate ABC transporter permease subunit PstC [Corynebacterium sp.]